MELALLLVLVVIVELAITVFMLARHKDYLRRVSRLEKNVRKMAEVLNDIVGSEDGSLGGSGLDSGGDLASLVKQATPEDIEQAQAVLAALGINSEN